MAADVVRALGYLALGTRMKRIGERLQAQTQAMLAGEGVTVPAAHLPVLATLERMGAANIGDIAQALGVAQPGVTRMVDKLIAAGLVGPEPEGGDRRVRTVGLTPAGQRLVAEAKRTTWPALEGAVVEACASLSGSLLEQLAGLEDALAAEPLERRAARLRAKEDGDAAA